ncbi:hypothetical protein RQP46_003150 [Phenoliferia psychrophenolica]
MLLKDVKIQDLIDGKHLPPLTLKELEDYLCFVELAAENLYFRAFYVAYVKAYNASIPNQRTDAEMSTLSDSYHLALDAFFNPASPLELNVADGLRRQLEQEMATLPSRGTEPFLPPSSFEEIYRGTESCLERSFHRFLLYNVRNAERNRGRFAKLVGFGAFLLGIIPTVVCASLNKNRAWRAIGIPLWWFGVVVFLGGVKRIIMKSQLNLSFVVFRVVYLFGDSRQLRPWELQRESAPSSSASINQESGTGVSLYATTTRNTDYQHDLEKGSGGGSLHGSPSMQPTLHYFPTRPESLASVDSGPDATYKRSASRSTSIFYPPSFIQPSLSFSSPTFASLTQVQDPLVKRAQWETVMTAACYGLVGAALMSAICLSVPNHH